MRRRLALCCALALLVLPRLAGAQFGWFGQNKIQYRDFDWRVLSGAHVDVYYYPAEERIARLALSHAEDSYDVLVRKFNHRVTHRIPLIVYASHSDFEQTNVLPFVPPEGVLGVTEFLRRRVTVPFRGNYAEFRHTVRHELVHVFQLSIATQQFALFPRARRAGTPLWWSEGLAEYFSSEQETRDDMIVRDLVLNGRMPTITQLNGVYSGLVYPVGGDLHRWLGRRYGDWRVPLLYESLWKAPNFDQALQMVYGRSAEQLSAEWHYDLRQRFFPAVEGRRPLEIAGREIADLALKPVALPRGDSAVDVAYLSPRSGYTNIYATPLDREGRTRVLVEGQREPEFESFHEFASRMDARDGELVFGSKYGDRDALFFWSVAKNRVVGRYQFDSLVSVMSPAWSPGGDRVAFSGLTIGGISDLYVLEMRTGDIRRVTDDPYEDLDPTWLPDGASLVFSSDRAPGGDEGARNLYVVRLDGGAVRPLTQGDWSDESPRWDAEHGRVLFTSDRDGTFNLYSVDTLGNGRRETRVDDGAFDPAPLPGDGRVVVSGFSDLTWSLYALRPDSALRTDTFTLASDSGAVWTWRELEDRRTVSASSRPYERRFSLDFAAGGGTTGGAGYYSSQGGVFYFSDLLGDHVLVTSLATFGGGGFASLFSNLNADVFYLNQKRRLNWGIGAFRLAGTFEERETETLYDEKSTGIYGELRYPFSRFTRIEAQSRLEYSDRTDLFGRADLPGSGRRQGVLSSNFLSFVGDNALWVSAGPIDGMRWNFTGGVVTDLTHGAFENWTGVADVRRYFRTSLQSAVAVRAFSYVSDGTRPRPISIGGSWLLRGYPVFTEVGTRVWVANTEWRFPLTEYLTLGFPFGAVRFPEVQGAIFNDLAQRWNEDFNDHLVLGSAGLGFRMPLIPGVVLRLDVGRRYTLNGEYGFGPSRFVDFFFGYDY